MKKWKRSGILAGLLAFTLVWSNLSIVPTETVSAAGETVQVWLTDSGLSSKLAPQASQTFSKHRNHGYNAIFVDENSTFQTIEGFGASLTDSSAYLINEKLSPSARTAVMTNLFSPTNGIGVNWLRQPMGASDFSHVGNYNYKNSPTAPFSIAHDEINIIPLLQQARALNPNLKIMASPWSAPGWMKENGSMLGGDTAKLKTANYGDFATYFANFVDAYNSKGLPIYAVTPQNEPRWASTGYPGMYMTPQEQANFVKNNLGPALSGKNVKIFAFDHNWDIDYFLPEYYTDAAATAYTDGSAWHCYGGEASVMSTMHYRIPSKGTYQTECTSGIWTEQTTGQFDVDMKNLTKTMRHWSKNFIAWNLALDTNNGPTNGGCTTCTGLIEINQASGNVKYTESYYSMGHFSKFVLPGAVRIASTGYAWGLHNAAFKNPDGSKVLVAYNETSSDHSFDVVWGDQSYSYTLPAKSAATFKWSGTQSKPATVIPGDRELRASSYHEAFDIVPQTSEDTHGGLNISFTKNNSWLLYKNVDIAGINGVTARVANGHTNTSIEVRTNSPSGPLLGTIPVNGTGGWQNWTSVSASLTGASGVKDIYLVFKGGANLNSIQFTSANLLQNPGFESGNTTNWSAWYPSGAASVHSVDNDYPHSGTYKLVHHNAAAAYQQTTYQAVGVSNGVYRATVWVRSSGGQNQLRLEASNYGGAARYDSIDGLSIPWNWTQLVIDNINVTNGTITIGVHSNAAAGNWAAIDDFKLTRLQ
ncbi:carbohydrate-binding protein [Paenibacillus paeoniae]|nr:carbohydrate-binding protein [Paenibacillus paeoniae]